jgi:hypothetical protein
MKEELQQSAPEEPGAPEQSEEPEDPESIENHVLPEVQ